MSKVEALREIIAIRDRAVDCEPRTRIRLVDACGHPQKRLGVCQRIDSGGGDDSLLLRLLRRGNEAVRIHAVVDAANLVASDALCRLLSRVGGAGGSDVGGV